ncbi:MAG: glycosyltransferase [Oscillospiraceae bacterium]|nr:glycosyltransferase [Oscillospiraceae bacterium]
MMRAGAQTAFSVVIPAHNEAQYIGKCLAAVRAAADAVRPCRTEIIVVANRCTDQTADIARQYGAVVLQNDDKCISSIRNTGVRAAKGRVIVTVDADTLIPHGTLKEVRQMLSTGRYIGGGANPRFDRMSPGIFCSTLYVAWNLLPVMRNEHAYLSSAVFWFRKADFERAGGFDESLVSLEDMDFARRMNRMGRAEGKRWRTLKASRPVTSARKFDQFGDWYLIRNRKLTKQIFTGRDRKAADSFYYETR